MEYGKRQRKEMRSVRLRRLGQVKQPSMYQAVTSLLTTFQLKSIGRVESTLTDLAAAPRQADEGAPEAVLVFEPEVRDALGTLQPGETVILLTWLDRAWTSRVLSTDIRQR